MKFLLIALAVFGVAQAADVIQPKSIQSAFDEIKAAIPSERIIKIVQSCAGDKEIQQIPKFLRNVFLAVFEVLRNDADPIEFNTKKFAPKSCGGWHGVYELMQQEVSLKDLSIVIRKVYAKYPEFAAVWDRMGAAASSIVRLLSDPTVANIFGFSLELVLDFVINLFWGIVLD